MALSNMPPGYSEDADAPEHGKDTALYADFQKIHAKYESWFLEAKKHHEFYNDEMQADAEKIGDMMAKMADDIFVPL